MLLFSEIAIIKSSNVYKIIYPNGISYYYNNDLVVTMHEVINIDGLGKYTHYITISITSKDINITALPIINETNTVILSENLVADIISVLRNRNFDGRLYILLNNVGNKYGINNFIKRIDGYCVSYLI